MPNSMQQTEDILNNPSRIGAKSTTTSNHPSTPLTDVIYVYMKMFVLISADDTVLMANDAKSGPEYCAMWNVSVNTEKTQKYCYFF